VFNLEMDVSLQLIMAGIYFHIPFCKQACHYCDFHFSTQMDQKGELIACLLKELDLQQNYLEGEVIETIYFGGGTPSLLSPAELREILNHVYKYFSVADRPEVTLEANPDDLSLNKLLEMRSAGINRLSIGIQSFDDQVLRFLNRAHGSAQATNAIISSQQAGFDNVSIDLIYAIPGQSVDQWLKNIRQGIDLHPQHISSYSLTIEEKTVFGRWAHAGKFKGIPDDDAASQLETLVEQLDRHDYHQYEVSNFSLPGYESKHNTSYWKGKKYLGIGPSAHSYDLQSRQFNVANNSQYIRSIQKGTIPFTLDPLTKADHINEYLLTTLRTSWGADLPYILLKWNYDLLKKNAPYIAQLQAANLAVIEHQHLTLTPKGKLLADKIASDLFLDTPEVS
jgi:oxygen-independent coproporphyrinogen III oxidase